MGMEEAPKSGFSLVVAVIAMTIFIFISQIFTPLFATEATLQDLKNQAANQLIIQWDGLGEKQTQLSILMLKRAAHLRKTLRQSQYGVVESNQSELLLQELRAVGIKATRQKILQLDAVPNDPLFSQQWGLTYMGLPSVWDAQPGSTSTVVAVSDSGVDLLHPDLKPNLWVNPGEDLNADGVVENFERNGIDDDGNGVIDDFHGMDCRGNDGDPTFGSGEFHGTATSGTIGAVANNNIGMSGAMLNVRLMILRVFGASGALLSDMIECNDYARHMGAKVINASWSTSDDDTMLNESIAQFGSDANGTFVKSASNQFADCSVANPPQQSLCYPQATPIANLISVAASTPTGDKASFSNWGATTIDLTAPGTGIQVTMPTVNGSYTFLDGTSFSSPLVAGVVGLLYSKNPQATPALIRQVVFSTVHPLPWAQPGGLYPLKSGGEINAAGALATMPIGNQLPVIDRLNSNIELGIAKDLHSGDHVELAVVAHDPDGLTSSLQYAWSVLSRPTASAMTLSAEQGESTTFLPDRPGTYRIKITATDQGMESATKYLSVIVNQLSIDAQPSNSTNSATNSNQSQLTAVGNGVDGGQVDTFVTSSCGVVHNLENVDSDQQQVSFILLLIVSIGMLLLQRLPD
jgi:subtilisin family serine protease